MAIEKQHLSVVKSSQNPIVFIREVWQELKKTTWPNWQQANRLTWQVIAVVVVIGAYMWILNIVFAWLIKRILPQ
ncbi:preprotein translocase subunit SecE [Chthonomonas calidirosea]|uniref:preprotein translocase subunit SecE n=1 Tax=Chthonomonas calidirosea TaxID=454171 RepID=UPI0006ECC427|nr:preprotein translocase subunit SecE [Chthonomonas calidirosea]CEK13608.1 preprotein translocase, SecE subunit [Chthonomonas calidirosea]